MNDKLIRKSIITALLFAFANSGAQAITYVPIDDDEYRHFPSGTYYGNYLPQFNDKCPVVQNNKGVYLSNYAKCLSYYYLKDASFFISSAGNGSQYGFSYSNSEVSQKSILLVGPEMTGSSYDYTATQYYDWVSPKKTLSDLPPGYYIKAIK